MQGEVTVCIGQQGREVGQLGYARKGQRESSSFVYLPQWLAFAEAFEVSPDLPLGPNRQFRKARSKHDSVFHFAIADTAPDGWGCRVIARDHARRRREGGPAGAAVPAALTEWDYLLGVDDESRVGALRLRGADGNYLRTAEGGARSTPPLVELRQLLGATRAVEMGTETAADLRYLRGRGTSLGGLRPKCSVVDDDGSLSIGKFPSVNDDRAVTKGEVLALNLARLAGIDAASARTVQSDGTSVAVVRRFDRVPGGARIPYMSAASILQAGRDEERSYTEIADAIRARCADPRGDLRELWRRIAFNLLITNVDDHLQNHGFLHLARGQWRLSPAFDLNPFPDKDRESKTWLSEAAGPVSSVAELVDACVGFAYSRAECLGDLARIVAAVAGWRTAGSKPPVGMSRGEIEQFAPAFEHAEVDAARRLAGS